jgi:hypothetical protein
MLNPKYLASPGVEYGYHFGDVMSDLILFKKRSEKCNQLSLDVFTTLLNTCKPFEPDNLAKLLGVPSASIYMAMQQLIENKLIFIEEM